MMRITQAKSGMLFVFATEEQEGKGNELMDFESKWVLPSTNGYWRRSPTGDILDSSLLPNPRLS